MPSNDRHSHLAGLLAAALAGIMTLAVTLALAGCGSSGSGSAGGSTATHTDTRPSRPAGSTEARGSFYAPRPIAGVDQRKVGHGARAAWILTARGEAPSARTVLFLHGWEPLPPSSYGAWIHHLTGRGYTVLFPAYQGSSTKPEAFLANALAGIRSAIAATGVRPRIDLAVGHNTGGVLAFDYAAVATGEGLPVPAAALAVYPGRDPGDGRVTSSDLSRIPASTRLAVIAGKGDPIPNAAAQARGLLRGAVAVPSSRRSFLGASAALGTTGPWLTSPAARRTYWAPADRLAGGADGPVG